MSSDMRMLQSFATATNDPLRQHNIQICASMAIAVHGMGSGLECVCASITSLRSAGAAASWAGELCVHDLLRRWQGPRGAGQAGTWDLLRETLGVGAEGEIPTRIPLHTASWLCPLTHLHAKVVASCGADFPAIPRQVSTRDRSCCSACLTFGSVQASRYQTLQVLGAHQSH